jgi:hypothetical protein
MLWNIPQLLEERLNFLFPPKAHQSTFITWARKRPTPLLQQLFQQFLRTPAAISSNVFSSNRTW